MTDELQGLGRQLMGEDLGEACEAAKKFVLHGLRGDSGIVSEKILPVEVKVEVDRLNVKFGDTSKLLAASVGLREVREYWTRPKAISELIIRRAFSSSDDAAAQPFGEWEPLPSAEDLLTSCGKTAKTPRAASVIARLQEECDLALLGPSASGKTVTVLQASRSLASRGWRSIWLDLSDPNRNAIDILFAMCRMSRASLTSCLVVIDNCQCDPKEVARSSQLLTQLKEAMRTEVRTIAIGWGNAAQAISEAFPNIVPVQCTAGEVVERLIAELVTKAVALNGIKESVRELAGDDVLVARLAVEYFNQNDRLPTEPQLAESAYLHIVGSSELSDGAKELLYTIACLGQFEVETSSASASRLSKDGLDELIRDRVVRASGDYLSLGHRTLSHLVASYLRSAGIRGSNLPPERLAYSYLKDADEKQTVSMLDRLDLARYAATEQDSKETAFLASAWLTRRTLLNYLDHLSRRTGVPWGDNLASAVFAAQSFASASMAAWTPTAAFIRSRWEATSPDILPTPIGAPTVDRLDFDEIRKEMKNEEDGLPGQYGEGDRSVDLDFDVMHRTWVLGLLLGFEGTAPRPDPGRIRTLRAIAANVQEPNGCFYPARVPWITARVVIGLCLAGEPADSPVLRRACSWLRTSYPGGARRTIWESGTGRWNTNIETTAMCVNALVRAGVPKSDPALKIGASFLTESREKWIAPGREVDCAFTLETLTLFGVGEEAVGRDIASLLTWASARAAWAATGRTASDSHEQSSKVPFVATYLINIVWETVQSQLPTLLEGLRMSTTSTSTSRTISGSQWGLRQPALRDCIEDIDQRIAVEVGGRIHVSGAAVDKNRAMWEKRGTESRACRDALQKLSLDTSAPKSQELVDSLTLKVDNLGQLCFGTGWRAVQQREGVTR